MATAAISPDFDWQEGDPAEENSSAPSPRDAELLETFRTRADQSAFQSLVKRHGPMVLDVCKSILKNATDAEDAFQETFVVLAKSAGAIQKPTALGSWLHGVAIRTSQKARTRLAARRKHESQIPAAPAAAMDDANWRETLHTQLSELPERFRTPLVLCYLQGATQESAALELVIAKSTLRDRLDRGRELLRSKLLRAGLGPTAMLAFAAWHTASASANIPATLVTQTVATATALPAPTLATGAAWMTVAGASAAIITLAAALAFLFLNAPAASPPPAYSVPLAAAQPETDDEKASRLATTAHAQAAAIEKLPQLSYQARYRYGLVDSLRAIECNLETMHKALKDPVLDKDWYGYYERTIAWDERRLFDEMRPRDTDTAYVYRFGTREDAWDRSESKDHQTRMFVRRNNITEFWAEPSDPMHTSMHWFELSYVRLTHHKFWWGNTINRTDHTMSFIPLDEVTWKLLPAEKFGEELCDVVESTHKKSTFKGQRLWIGQKSGRVRGVLSYLDRSNPNELARFEDYREVAPGAWLPFKEVRTFPHHSDLVNGKQKLFRSELTVESARTDQDLAKHYVELLPKDGDRMQDQRFGTALNFEYRADRTDDETRKLAEIQKKKELEGMAEFHKIVKPLDSLLGKEAPLLAAEGWLGGKRPDVTGKPYLVHFWATWCGPCKGDMELLKNFAEQGFTIVGVHPPGTPPEEIEKLIADRKLNYPTHLATDNQKDPNGPKLAGYPSGVFPYCILVDARGRVTAHGLLSDIEGRIREASLLTKFLDKPAPKLEGEKWFNTSSPIDLASLNGKVVLLDFWGQWCGPCVAKLPEIESLHAKYKDQGLVVIGVHSARDSEKLDEFLKEKKVSYPIVIDKGKSAERYMVSAWPKYFLLNRAGEVVWGFTHEPPTAAQIEELLKSEN